MGKVKFSKDTRLGWPNTTGTGRLAEKAFKMKKITFKAAISSRGKFHRLSACWDTSFFTYLVMVTNAVLVREKRKKVNFFCHYNILFCRHKLLSFQNKTVGVPWPLLIIFHVNIFLLPCSALAGYYKVKPYLPKTVNSSKGLFLLLLFVCLFNKLGLYNI